MLSQNIPPTFFPRLVFGTIAVLSAVLVAGGLRRPRQPRPPVPPRVLGTAALLVASVAAVRLLGLLGTSAAVALALPLYWGERRPLRLVLLAVLLPAGIHLVFGLALGVRFPAAALW